MGRVAVGVNGIKLEGKDEVIALCLVRPNADLLVISEQGVGKRTGLEEFRAQDRAGSGIRAMQIAPKPAPVAAAPASGRSTVAETARLAASHAK